MTPTAKYVTVAAFCAFITFLAFVITMLAVNGYLHLALLVFPFAAIVAAVGGTTHLGTDDDRPE